MFGIVTQVIGVVATKKINKWALISLGTLTALLALQLIAPAHAGVPVGGGH